MMRNCGFRILDLGLKNKSTIRDPKSEITKLSMLILFCIELLEVS